MLKYNSKSLRALTSFFKYRNEIDVFTEDNIVDKEFYKVLLGRLTSNKVTINDITPLGCKSNVINEYERTKSDSTRKRIFIVDGDLELINDANPLSSRGLYVLPAYCIENFLIDEIAGIELVYFNKGTEDKGKIKSLLNFENWIIKHKAVLIDLFIHFAILRKVGGGPVIKHAGSFIKDDSGTAVLDDVKINHYIDELKSLIIDKLNDSGFSNSDEVYREEIKKYKSKWKNSKTTFLNIVSGKNYLLPLYNFHLKKCVGTGNALFPTKSFKLFLANHCKLSRLDGLKNQLLS